MYESASYDAFKDVGKEMPQRLLDLGFTLKDLFYVAELRCKPFLSLSLQRRAEVLVDYLDCASRDSSMLSLPCQSLFGDDPEVHLMRIKYLGKLRDQATACIAMPCDADLERALARLLGVNIISSGFSDVAGRYYVQSEYTTMLCGFDTLGNLVQMWWDLEERHSSGFNYAVAAMDAAVAVIEGSTTHASAEITTKVLRELIDAARSELE